MFSHAELLASAIPGELPPVLGLLGLVRLVLPAPFVFAGLSVYRALPSSVAASTGVPVVLLKPGNLSVGESSPG